MGALNKMIKQDIAKTEDIATEGAPVEATPAKTGLGGAKKGTQVFIDKGKNIYNSLTEEDKANIASGSSAISFLHLIGTAQKSSPRKEGTELKPSFIPVGMVCKAEADIKVPSIPFAGIPKDLDSAPTFDTIEWRDIKAGEQFIMTRVEAMFCVTNPAGKMGGYISKDGNPKGIALSVKVNDAYFTTKRLPTPAFSLTSSTGSIKEDMVAVDVKQKDGTWALKPEYAEKFAALLIKSTPNRSGASTGGNKKTLSTTSAIALALGATFSGK